MQDLPLIALKVSVYSFFSLNWLISQTRMGLDVKKKFMLKLKCHLLSVSVHLLQWFSASLPSSTPLWTTLSKFTMAPLSTPVFSAPSPVHTQVRIHTISSWCHFKASSYFCCDYEQPWFEHSSPWGVNFDFRGRGWRPSNYPFHKNPGKSRDKWLTRADLSCL